MKAREVMKAYGNMTEVEKQMNREDLNAWKVYDNNQYSLIPGINHQKIFPNNQRQTPDLHNKSADAVDANFKAKVQSKDENF